MSLTPRHGIFILFREMDEVALVPDPHRPGETQDLLDPRIPDALNKEEEEELDR